MAELKRKVSLREKHSDSDSIKDTPITPPAPEKSKWWIWVLIAVIVAIIVILLVRNKKSDVDPIAIDPTPVVVVTDATSPDAQQAEDTSNVAPEEDNNGTTPAQDNSTSQQNNESNSSAVTPNGSNNSQSPDIGNKPSLSNDLEENARRVIHGDFGNGQDRKDALGNSYNEIQNRVNEIYRERNMH